MGLFGKKKEIIESFRAKNTKLSNDLYIERKEKYSYINLEFDNQIICKKK